MNLQQARNLPADALSLPTYFLQETRRINCVNEVDIWHDVLHFVRLQVSDEVPLNVIGQGSTLGLQFLHVTFAEDSLPAIVGLTYHIGWMKLTHSHKPCGGWQL